jgi:hypothetical protein
MSQTTFTPDLARNALGNPGSLTLDAHAPEAGGVIVDATRPRQTEAPATPFRELLAGGVSVLMGGAAVATHVMGAPRLAAAITDAESRAATVLTGTPTASGAVLPTAAGHLGAGSGASNGTAALAAAGTGSDASDLVQMQAMQRESQVFNMQLLALQDQVQQDSQRFSTLSNVMRAKHDTAKAAVSNIRS